MRSINVTPLSPVFGLTKFDDNQIRAPFVDLTAPNTPTENELSFYQNQKFKHGKHANKPNFKQEFETMASPSAKSVDKKVSAGNVS